MMESRARILLADDHPGARTVMRAALRKAGFEVSLAVDGNDALRQFGAGHWDLVMLDVDMPDLSGHAVCAEIRRRAGELLPIVMVTGMDDLQSVEKAYESGATDFISKPINWALLSHRVRYLLRGYQTLLQLRAAESAQAAVLRAIPDLLFEVDLDGRYLDCRAPSDDMLLAPREQLIGRTVAEMLPADVAETVMQALREAHDKGTSAGRQYALQLARGVRWFELSVSRKAAPGIDEPHFVVLARDITERKEAEMRIARLAYFDALTGLPNRQAFLERVDRQIARAGGSGARFGVLFMDLDGFKQINDTMGHGAGDLVLQWAADRLRQGLRPTDVVARPVPADHLELELARLGGDEFTALILDMQQPEDALLVAHRIGQLMRRPFMVEGREVLLTTSIGIATYPEDGEDAKTLLKHADTAMYHAKGSGRDNAQLYSASLTLQAMQRLELDTHLRLALERDEFHLVYQPQVDVRSGRIGSVEALLRWRHPTRGAVGPLDFIPLAEENGTILAIGRWVLRRACTDAALWHRQGHAVRVAVNLSPTQFTDASLVPTVLDALSASGLPASALELEITESSVMENTEETIRTLHAFRACGVRVALDDFGTGYSSLSYLTRMPINNLKIDRSFVSGLQRGGQHGAIVRAVLAMADSLGMHVTAEGVETAEQASVLAAMSCDQLQGYFFSRPVAADEIAPLLTRQWPLGARDEPSRPQPLAQGAPAER
ncbi:MAG: EAL domain-containing protein [Burkholderiaceae bacterium]